MKTEAKLQGSQHFQQTVLGSRRLSNYFWATVAFNRWYRLSSSGIIELSQKNLLLVSDPSGLQFIPQGAALSFYGVAGSLVGIYLC